MPFTVTMPKLSPTMEEGTVAKWHKKEGEFVDSGELLLEIATDKATVEYNALDEGWLRKILVPEGASAHLNEPIALFTVSKEESIQDFVLSKPPQAETPVTKPSETPVSAAPAPSRPQFAEPAFVPPPPLTSYRFEYPRETLEKKARATPLAKKIAKEKGLDLTSVQGTGTGGRITADDLERAQPAATSFSHLEIPTLPPGSFEEIALTPMRKVIARRLQESKTFIPHFYVSQQVEVSALVALREQLKTIGQKATYNDLVIRATALALRKHPAINVGYNSVNQTLVQYKTIDISLAVTVAGGLITPIIRHADYKSLGEISVEAHLLAEKARQGKLAPEEYQGGSFSISNLGMFGISSFTAVINPPQGAILAVGGIEERAVVRNGKVRAGKTLELTLSLDHRAIDGAAAAEFLKTLQHYLENPASLLI